MRIPHHLECNICGVHSVTVQDRYQLTEIEKQALREFVQEHTRCAQAREGFRPEDACTARPDGWTPPQVGPFGSDKPDPRSTPRPHGYFEYMGPYGEVQRGDTISCCHCRKHMEVRAGLERQLGFCALCYNGKHGSGTTCGGAACQTHIPFERRLENIEAGRPILTPLVPQASLAGLGGAVLLERSDDGLAGETE